MNSYTRSRFILAVKKFNEKKYFEAHEIFEDIWFDERGKSRDFFHGLLHISVGLYHLKERNNFTGAVLQFEKAKSRFEKFRISVQPNEIYYGIDLEGLLKAAGSILSRSRKRIKISRFPRINLIT